MNETRGADGRSIRWKTSLFAVSTILGIMITVQYTGVHRSKPLISSDSIELKAQLLSEADYAQALNSKIMELKSRIAQYKATQGDVESQRKQLTEELQNVRQEAALTPLTGPGITITLIRNTDAYNKKFLLGIDPAELQIDDQILRALDQILFSNGAQGVAINNNRISTYSTIRMIGSPPGLQILVNGKAVADPYQIKVVGDVQSLKAGLLGNQVENAFRNLAYDINIATATQQDPITLPAYSQGVEIRFAKVDTQGEKP